MKEIIYDINKNEIEEVDKDKKYHCYLLADPITYDYIHITQEI